MGACPDLLLSGNGDRGCLRSELAAHNTGWISAQDQRSAPCWQVGSSGSGPQGGVLSSWLSASLNPPFSLFSWAIFLETIQ